MKFLLLTVLLVFLGGVISVRGSDALEELLRNYVLDNDVEYEREVREPEPGADKNAPIPFLEIDPKTKSKTDVGKTTKESEALTKSTKEYVAVSDAKVITTPHVISRTESKLKTSLYRMKIDERGFLWKVQIITGLDYSYPGFYLEKAHPVASAELLRELEALKNDEIITENVWKAAESAVKELKSETYKLVVKVLYGPSNTMVAITAVQPFKMNSV